MPTPFLAFRQTSFSKRLQRYYILFIICKLFENFIFYFVKKQQICHFTLSKQTEPDLFPYKTEQNRVSRNKFRTVFQRQEINFRTLYILIYINCI